MRIFFGFFFLFWIFFYGRGHGFLTFSLFSITFPWFFIGFPAFFHTFSSFSITFPWFFIRFPSLPSLFPRFPLLFLGFSSFSSHFPSFLNKKTGRWYWGEGWGGAVASTQTQLKRLPRQPFLSGANIFLGCCHCADVRGLCLRFLV